MVIRPPYRPSPARGHSRYSTSIERGIVLSATLRSVPHCTGLNKGESNWSSMMPTLNSLVAENLERSPERKEAAMVSQTRAEHITKSGLLAYYAGEFFISLFTPQTSEVCPFKAHFFELLYRASQTVIHSQSFIYPTPKATPDLMLVYTSHQPHEQPRRYMPADYHAAFVLGFRLFEHLNLTPRHLERGKQRRTSVRCIGHRAHHIPNYRFDKLRRDGPWCSFNVWEGSTSVLVSPAVSVNFCSMASAFRPFSRPQAA